MPIRVLKSGSDNSLHASTYQPQPPKFDWGGPVPSVSPCQVFQNLQLAWLFGHVHFIYFFQLLLPSCVPFPTLARIETMGNNNERPKDEAPLRRGCTCGCVLELKCRLGLRRLESGYPYESR